MNQSLIKAIIVAIPLIFASTKSEAYTRFIDQDQVFGLITHVFVDVSDKVKDGCWTNARVTKGRIKTLFERKNIRTLDEMQYTINVINPIVLLIGYGYRLPNGMCSGYAEFMVFAEERAWYGGASDTDRHLVSFDAVIYESGRLMTVRNTLNTNFTEFFEEQVNEIAMKISRQKEGGAVKNLRDQLPQLFYPPTSRKDMEEALSKDK